MSSSGPETLDRSNEMAILNRAPNWDAIHIDVHCSRCGYNLRTLEKPRCPECGFEFEWSDLLSLARARLTDLFEYQYRRRPVRSWCSTFWRSFRPARFWPSVSIHSQIIPLPLWIHLSSVIPLFYLGSVLVAANAGWIAGVLLKLDDAVGILSVAGESRVRTLEHLAIGYLYIFVDYWWYLSIFTTSLVLDLLVTMIVLIGLHRMRAIHRIRPVQVLRAFSTRHLRRFSSRRHQ
ncbi:MAG: hypothetical protein IPK83_03695 [Planctomycetes bacterium]|nr:hypothetical protein [Planctomycetota bacterium]